MEIKENASLLPYNTFGIDVNSQKVIFLNSINEIDRILKFIHDSKKELLILGGGSNILFTHNFDGITLINKLKGIDVLSENENEITLKVAAGEVWHEFVMYCVKNNYGGIENLSLIPGKVGASPMQNIGAYGVEVKDVITEVEAVDLRNGKVKKFSNEECEFDYRSSIFKTTHKGQYLITAVNFKLNKNPQLNTTYGAINTELAQMQVKELSIKAVSDAVINIRSSKLPDPKKIGNAGSFFKNPLISKSKMLQLKADFEDIPIYPVNDEAYKVAAGWMIEQCGWKGKTFDNYGVHKLQALVLVNYGGAKGKEIYQLSEAILQSVKQKFDVELEREVNIL